MSEAFSLLATLIFSRVSLNIDFLRRFWNADPWLITCIHCLNELFFFSCCSPMTRIVFFDPGPKSHPIIWPSGFEVFSFFFLCHFGRTQKKRYIAYIGRIIMQFYAECTAKATDCRLTPNRSTVGAKNVRKSINFIIYANWLKKCNKVIFFKEYINPYRSATDWFVCWRNIVLPSSDEQSN